VSEGDAAAAPGPAASTVAEPTGPAPHGRGDWRRAVLMGNPTHFSVKGGANPHTRTRLGTRRRVDRTRAIAQWHGLRDRLRDHGVRVLVVPPDPAQPGLVYPANAGFLEDVDAERPHGEKRFFLANLLPTRAGEQPHYARVLRDAGFRLETIDARYRMEGEADFFPSGERYLLTHGGIERQRFVPAWGLPPWRRVYGFRTDRRVEHVLAPVVAPKEVLALELVLEAHYHGDTALCAFGPGRRHLLVHPAALAPEGLARVRATFGDAVIELAEPDAARYAANSFTLTQGGDSFLFVPAGLSDRLLDEIRERGVTPVSVDVSEFLKKGGGSVKCMIGDLGPVRVEDLREAGEA
jgi:N-dimethylarginine dimethylaminohydrolase